MTLTIVDIERWDAGDVREVFHAAQSRAQAAFDAADGLATLPAFSTWGGEAAEAAKQAIGQTRRDLDAHGNEALAVANATSRAAESIDQIKSDLAQLESDAESSGLEINPATNRIVPMPGSTHGRREMQARIPALQARLDGLVAEANSVDAALANAINMADGSAPIPASPHDNRPEIQDALTKPLPEDPRQFNDLWHQLTPEEKDWLYSQDHNIGNHPGMAFGGDRTNPGRDYYNRLHLDELHTTNQAEIDRLRTEHPDWAAGDAPFLMSKTYGEWKKQWDDANHAQSEYVQVQQALKSPDGLPRLLGLLDEQGHAAISINNPDTARRTATFVPGTGQDLTRLEFSTSKSEQMLAAALRADPSLKPGDVSVTTWMGYDRPMNVVTDAPSASYAHNGAAALDDFQAGLRASHNDVAAPGGTSINTVIGHSYGSTLVGAAGLDGHHLDANNVVAVGSPGVLAAHAGDLNLAPGAHVFATRAENDVIGIATYASLGPDPMSASFGGIPFEAAPGVANPLGLPSVDAHSSYWSSGNPALDNMGRIIAGQTNVTPPRFTP